MSDEAPTARLARLADVGLHTASLLHELRQPLFAVQAAAELGLSGDADARESLARVLDHLVHVRDLVDRYAGLGRTDEPVATLDLREPVLAAVGMLAHRARRLGAELTCECPDAATLTAREAELRQIALNLVQNALDAVEGQPDRRVRVSVSLDHGARVLTVEDSGPGIPEALRETLFEPFVSGKPMGSGTGLGLYITRALVDATRGVVAFESGATGTAVSVRWPG